MRTDKDIKKELKAKASQNPEKYYATDVLTEAGFQRGKCTVCGTYFWSKDKNRKVCGDSMCAGGFTFFEDSPVKKKMDYITVWKEFAALFTKMGYTPINRYPVVARWNPTMEFTIASIAAFQPFVVSGEVEPPANPLVIPQFCVRFGDIDNIGITASHQTGFVMIGQHMFVPKEEWDQDKVFRDIKRWLNEGLGIPDEELTFHEDAWAGGGNSGPCMEYFCRGLELGNQVYMLYEQTPDDELVDLTLKVLDMGMGHERNAWFTLQTPTQHQAIYPTVVKKLLDVTGVILDEAFMKKFVPISGKLNIDEVEDIQKAWEEVADILSVDVETLKNKILPVAGIFSIADHTRTLLFVLNDGGLPSNVGGGYNLRVLIRRALSFVDKFKWNIRLADVCRWHAEYLKPLFPELMNNLDNIDKILDVERKKYEATKQKTKLIVKKIVQKEVTEDMLLTLYDSNGIAPELVKEEAEKLGKKIEVPDNFFGKVSELHEKKEQVHATKKEEKIDLEGVPETVALYYDDYTDVTIEAKVLKIIGKKIVLDKTRFYPTSGGQMHDTGTLHNIEVIDVYKQGAHIIHELAKKPDFKEGDVIIGKIELTHRKQLTQHHTSAHIVNAAAKKVLGPHINQAGAKKTRDKAHLDITHYQGVSDSELKKIEDEANKIVRADVVIEKKFYPRREAEDTFGMEIYQGGAVPGKMVRVIFIKGFDVEACGGTHLNRTGEVGEIKILKATKIQDGIVRLTFTAGKSAQKAEKSKDDILLQASALLGVPKNQVPGRAKEIFTLWKKAIKKKKITKKEELRFSSKTVSEGDILAETAAILKTQPQFITNTLKRFLKELEEYKKGL